MFSTPSIHSSFVKKFQGATKPVSLARAAKHMHIYERPFLTKYIYFVYQLSWTHSIRCIPSSFLFQAVVCQFLKIEELNIKSGWHISNIFLPELNLEGGKLKKNTLIFIYILLLNIIIHQVYVKSWIWKSGSWSLYYKRRNYSCSLFPIVKDLVTIGLSLQR